MTLAQWSNLFVYASIAMYAMAFVAFAVSFGASRTPSAISAADSRCWPAWAAPAPRRRQLRAVRRPGSDVGGHAQVEAAGRGGREARAAARAESHQIEAELAAGGT